MTYSKLRPAVFQWSREQFIHTTRSLSANLSQVSPLFTTIEIEITNVKVGSERLSIIHYKNRYTICAKKSADGRTRRVELDTPHSTVINRHVKDLSLIEEDADIINRKK